MTDQNQVVWPKKKHTGNFFQQEKIEAKLNIQPDYASTWP